MGVICGPLSLFLLGLCLCGDRGISDDGKRDLFDEMIVFVCVHVRGVWMDV